MRATRFASEAAQNSGSVCVSTFENCAFGKLFSEVIRSLPQGTGVGGGGFRCVLHFWYYCFKKICIYVHLHTINTTTTERVLRVIYVSDIMQNVFLCMRKTKSEAAKFDIHVHIYIYIYIYIYISLYATNSSFFSF